jgi:hypothetical protein
MANTRRRSDKRQRDRADERAQPTADAAVADQPVHTTASRDDIARRAYDLYQQRGGAHGNDLEDWLRAERELLMS